MLEKENNDEDKNDFNINNNGANNLFIQDENPQILELEDNFKDDMTLITFDEEKKEIPIKDIDIDVKKYSTIKCPNKKCFADAIININPSFFEINSYCGQHIYKIDIIDFILSSFKEDKETCSFCDKTYGDIKNINSNLYKCSCGKNICEECKKTKLKKNKKKHILIDFKEKDNKCFCDKTYIMFCLNCNKNLCHLCLENHKDHKMIKNKIIQKEQLKQLKEKLQNQKNIIKEFNKIIDEWLQDVVDRINEYKKKLDLYAKINEVIIEKYNSSNNSYQANKNVQYLNFYFDETVYNLIKNKHNKKKQTEVIFNFLNEKNYINLEPKEKDIETIEQKYSFDLKDREIVKHICELKQKEFLVIGFLKNDNNEELNTIKKENDYNFKKKRMKYSLIENEEILSISELRNGNLLILEKKQFKIYEIDEDGLLNQYTMQTVKADDSTNFIHMIELTNGYLISISKKINTNERDQNQEETYDNIILWKKNLMSGEYEKARSIKIDKAIDLLEIDKNTVLVYCSDHQIYLYNSNNYERKQLGIIRADNINFKKMYKITNNVIIAIYNEFVLILDLTRISCILLSRCYDDVCYVPNSNNSFIATHSQLSGFDIINYDILEQKINCINIQNNILRDTINSIFSLSNGDIITCSSDTIKIWKIVRK